MEAQARRDWLAGRQSGIGGSDAAAIIGANPHKTALAVYRDKTEPLGPDLVNPAILRGRLMEPIVRGIYAEQTGRKVITVGMTRDPEHSYLIANVDGRVVEDEVHTGVVELKVPGLRNFSKWKTAGVPQMYYVQAQHYLMIAGPQAEFAGFGIFNAERWELLHFDIPRDDIMIAQLRHAEIRFWEEHVLRRIPPPLGPAIGEVVDMPAVAPGLIKRVPADLAPWQVALSEFYEARDLEKLAEDNKARASEGLKAVMMQMGAEVAQDERNRVYWQEQKGSKRVDNSLIEGRRLLDRDKVITAMSEKGFHSQVLADLVVCFDRGAVTIDDFKKQGAPSRPLKVFRLKGGDDEDEE